MYLTDEKKLKVFIDSTNYCEESGLDTQQLTNIIMNSPTNKNFIVTVNISDADLIIYRACAHLESKEKESIQDIKELLKLKQKKTKLLVWGCLPKINPVLLKEVYDGPLIGPEAAWDFFSDFFSLSKNIESEINANLLNPHKIPKQVNNGNRSQAEKNLKFYNYFGPKFGCLFHYRKNRIIKNLWYIKIVSGCKNNCTYCSDRLAYKSVKSVPIDKIVAQFELGLEKGYRDFFLVGRDLGSYGCDTGSNLADLLNKIIERNPEKDYELLLHNLSPSSLASLYSELEPALASKKITHLGTHIQSGSIKILKLMGKQVSLHEWSEVVKDLQKKYPHIHLETSIMVGFPGETDADFAHSLNLLNNIEFNGVTIYRYSEWPTLPSFKLKNKVSETIKDKRYNQVKQCLLFCETKRGIKNGQFFSLKGLKLFVTFGLVLFRVRAKNVLNNQFK